MLHRAVVHDTLLEEMPEDAGKRDVDGVRSIVRECVFDDQYPAMYE